MMEICEGMYGTSKSSYLALEGKAGRSRMIVRHSQKVDETKAGARSRFVESILIENADGERMLFPTKNLAPARAMTQHVAMGGGFTDPVGQQITEMAQTFANLGMASAYVANNTNLSEGAGIIREKCRCKMREMKKTFERMYRSENGYMTEAKKLEDLSRALNETDTEDTTPPPEKLEELRKTLNLEGSSFLSDAVVESVYRCVESSEPDERNGEEVLDEAKPAPETVSVLGRPVDKAAWDDLKAGKIALFGKPVVKTGRGGEASPEYSNKSGELILKLGAIVPMVKDNSLMALLGFVVDRLPDETDPAVGRKLRTLALYVINAAGMKMNEGLVGNHPAIRDFSRWLSHFDARIALSEWYQTERPLDTQARALKEALAGADQGFSVEAFMSSPEAADLIRAHSKHDADDVIEPAAITQALEQYLSTSLETQGGPATGDVGVLASAKLGEAIAALTRAGYMVASNGDGAVAAAAGLNDHPSTASHAELLDDVEDPTEGAMGEAQMGEDGMGEDGMGDGDLTREDVLLPKPNQGQGLAREVTPHTVADPDSGKPTAPGPAYIDRLRALSGMQSPSRQF